MSNTTNAIIIKPDEEKEVTQVKIEEAKKYYLTPKYKLWEEYFTKKKYKDTFGNATRSAALAYGIDNIDDDPKAYNVAHSIGQKNVQKCTNLKRLLLDQMGITHKRMYELYNNMIIVKKDVNLMYSLAEEAGIELPEYQHVEDTKVNVQQNTQINAQDVQVTFSPMIEKK